MKIYNSAYAADLLNKAALNVTGTTDGGGITTEPLNNIVQGSAQTYTAELLTISGELPLTFTSLNVPFNDYTVKGNVDNGTYVGVTTINMFDESNVYFGDWIGANGAVSHDQNYAAAYKIDLTDETYITTCSKGVIPYSYSICFYQADDTFIVRHHYRDYASSVNPSEVPNEAAYYILQIAKGGTQSDVITQDDVNSYKLFAIAGNYTAETLPEYEPYGYKIPLICAEATYNIYSGEPLRCNSDKTVCDDINYLTQTITRKVDNTGTPLETPTTDDIDVPTITPATGENTITSTSATPPIMDIKYYG